MSVTDVLIAGAGPTGLTLALRLAQKGIRLRIIETRDGPGQASRAMVVQARTLEFYQQLGLAEQLIERGIPIDSIHYSEHDDDVASLSWGDVGKDITPYPFVLSFPQDDHEHFLVEQLKERGIEVEWGVALSHFEQFPDHVEATVLKDGVEQHYTAAYLCSCEGARSTVRKQLGTGFPGGTYNQLFYVADVAVNGPPRTNAYLHAGKQNMVFMAPVRSTGMQRLIGVVPPELEAHEGITFDDLRPSVENMLGISVGQANWTSTYRVHHRVAEHFRVGRTFLLGDAGHLHSPAGGQGMNTGIGDAVNLAWKLADVIQHRASEKLLDTYETERIAFARKLVETTDRAFEGMVGQGWRSAFLRNWMLPHLAPLLSKFDTFRRPLFETLSQTRIKYRDSAISEGKVGELHAGDRMPWSGENFGNRSTLAWHLEVYGDVNAEFAQNAQQLGLTVERFTLTPRASRNGLVEHAAYLVRPDMHIALALEQQSSQALVDYLKRNELSFAMNGSSS
jgi:2-polyprenyl-6-methoxyphenol hydroxylase-like FAD-dependent oxidoreductase